jgi:hypothetical protein
MRRTDDTGLTLVELLVASAITATIAPMLTGALLVGWRTGSDTVDSLSRTRNRQLLPSLFTRDAQSAADLDRSPAASAACVATGDTLLVQFGTVQPRAGASNVRRSVGWVLTPTQLVERRTCAAGSTVVQSSVTVAHDALTAAVRCRTTYASAPAPTCAPTSRLVDLTVTDAQGTFTATGVRRAP